MNTLLEEALNNYKILDPQIEFIRHNENQTYKLKDTLSNNQYVMRIHKPNTDFSLDIFGDKKHSVDLLISEMNILKAISESTEILVQTPIRNNNSEFVTVLSDGTPVTLLTWIDGNTVEEIELTDDILYKIGEMVGKFHRFSKSWPKSKDLHRYSYDKSLLIRVISKIKTGVELNVLSNEEFKIVENTVNEIINRMNKLDLQKNSKGIVHSDLSKSNLIVSNEQIAPIDFCLCGNSYYYMDLGSLFSHFDNHKQQSCIINGYKSVIDEDINAKYIETFFVFQIILYIATHIENAAKWDWFNDAFNRWCKKFFIPFSNNIAFIITS